MFSKKEMNSYFYTTKGFYILFIPVAVPYTKIYERAESAGLKLKQKFGPILEKGKLFGSGWIGIEVEKPAADRDDVVLIQGKFETYLHKGAYKTLGKACQKIRKERPAAKEYYNLYLDDPRKVKPENCRTEILFR